MQALFTYVGHLPILSIYFVWGASQNPYNRWLQYSQGPHPRLLHKLGSLPISLVCWSRMERSIGLIWRESSYLYSPVIANYQGRFIEGKVHTFIPQLLPHTNPHLPSLKTSTRPRSTLVDTLPFSYVNLRSKKNKIKVNGKKDVYWFAEEYPSKLYFQSRLQSSCIQYAYGTSNILV